jgi:hypothetical protein
MIFDDDTFTANGYNAEDIINAPKLNAPLNSIYYALFNKDIPKRGDRDEIKQRIIKELRKLIIEYADNKDKSLRIYIVK